MLLRRGDSARAVQTGARSTGFSRRMAKRRKRLPHTGGPLDPPIGNYTKTFSDKHRLQLIAIPLYQAQGLRRENENASELN
jgi:hypothetical protein